MFRKSAYILLGISVLFVSGCVVRTYPLTKDRVDQELSSGNRGYLKGEAPCEIKERKTTRTIRVVEVELGAPTSVKKAAPMSEETTSSYESQTTSPPSYQEESFRMESATISEPAKETRMEKYTVQKNDTLQKISQRFYGTTKKWKKIYDANRDTLKSPDKLYPGKTINIPTEELEQLKGNFK